MTPMDEKFLKRGYYFPLELLDAWEKFHAPSKDYSPSAAGAFVVWMALGPIERDKIRKATYSGNIVKAIASVREILAQSFVDAEIKSALDTLTPAKKAQLLLGTKKTKRKGRGK